MNQHKYHNCRHQKTINDHHNVPLSFYGKAGIIEPILKGLGCLSILYS